MLTTQRKQLILTKLKQDGQVIAKSLSEELELSEDTIRRDLRELAKEGLLQRVHGGALPASPAVADFAGRTAIAPDAKIAIGKAAAHLIQPKQIVIVDGGTTALQLARHLPLNLEVTIVTHSPTIAVALVNFPNVEVILIGGKLFKHSVVAVGAAAIEAISKIRADIYFMGATGIHKEAGITTGDLEEAHIKHALSQRAAETILLASSEKLNAASPYLIMPLSQLSGLIVEKSVSPSVVKPFEKAGIVITRA
ncbi:MAG: DeoR/GlpR family DNA-binding transcription regulator [Trueperaceae bacterium]